MRKSDLLAYLVGFSFCLGVAGPAAAEDDDEELGLTTVASVGDDTSQVATRSTGSIVKDTRAVTVITREDIEEGAPRTTPEALESLVGVSVQKTSPAGGSPFVRGTTGQQTLLLIDGFRINSSIMRSGPNQYLNTINPLTLDRIEVLRGSGSVLYGSDAIGGVVSLHTRNPEQDVAAASLFGRGASMDRSLTGRAEFDANFGPVQVLAGFGGSRFNNLRGGSPLPNASVPQYDDQEQLFTGYDQVTGDAKAIVPLGNHGQFTAAGMFLYHLNAPRSDQCSGPPLDCRTAAEQFYDLGYVRYDADFEKVRDLSVGIALSRTHERREHVREALDRKNTELDELRAVQLFARGAAPGWGIGGYSVFRISYGIDGYFDSLDSEAATGDLAGSQVLDPRGKYLDGSSYMSGGGYVFGELLVGRRFGFTAGMRLSGFRADVSSDPEAGTAGFDESWFLPTFSAGARVALLPWLAAVANFDQGFRAPNLDDLTARSQEGPGFQIGNPDLQEETSNTAEIGLKVEHSRVRAHLFGFGTNIDDIIARELAICPAELASQCGSSAVFRLVNGDSARIFGVEAAGEVFIPSIRPWKTSVFGNLTWTRGTRDLGPTATEPLSKIPPVSGRVGARLRVKRVFTELVGRYAFEQDRLSPADIVDARIPEGGTEGYLTVDLRVGMRLSDMLRGTVSLINLTDESYRIHGSGVDGPGFGIVGTISGTLEAP